MKEYIEREAAIAEFQYRLDSKGDAWISSPIEMAQRAMRVADMKIIRNIPAADVEEVRHGEWRDDADKIDKHFHRHDFFCKKCNTRADYFIGGEGNWWSSSAPDYCPRCGIKMDGGADNATD